MPKVSRLEPEGDDQRDTVVLLMGLVSCPWEQKKPACFGPKIASVFFGAASKANFLFIVQSLVNYSLKSLQQRVTAGPLLGGEAWNSYNWIKVSNNGEEMRDKQTAANLS